MKDVLIINGRLITPETTLENKGLIISDGKIKGIVNAESLDLLEYIVIDAQGGLVLPGLIDIHTHGGAGSDFMDATFEDFSAIVKHNATHGVTGLLATTLTAPMDTILKCLDIIREYKDKEVEGSKILGTHLEGPFLSMKNKGAHDPAYLLVPTYENYKELLNYTDVIKLITVAPELTNAANMIKDFTDRGVVISGGHDAATEEDVLLAIENGMSHSTHAYCVMSSISRQDGRKHIGLCEMMLLDDRLTTEIIGDNRHTPPLLAKLIYKNKGAKKMCLVSDCLRPAGLPTSNILYKIGPKYMDNCALVVVEGDVAMLPDRSLFAGSLTTLDKMIKNMVEDCGIPLEKAVRMATLSPAEIIHVQEQRGSLEVGKAADVCIMDQKFNVIKTLVEGKVVYSKSDIAM